MCYTFPGIFARLRAMASSTAFSCFRSSSRRVKVLVLLDFALVDATCPASAGLPGTLVTLPGTLVTLLGPLVLLLCPLILLLGPPMLLLGTLESLTGLL